MGKIRYAAVDVPASTGYGPTQVADLVHQWNGVGENLLRPRQLPDGSWDLYGPWLAKDYEISPDLSSATVHIQKGVQFHKGYGEMTAEDIVWVINTSNARLNPASIHWQAGDFAALFDAWEVIDPYTLKINFAPGGFDVRWEGNFVNNYGQAFSVTSKKAYDQNGEEWVKDPTNTIATGPFEVVEWIRDDHFIWRAVPNHWYRTAKLKEFTAVEVPELASRVAGLRTGAFDAAYIDLKLVTDLLEEGFKTYSTGLGTQQGIFFAGNLWETHHALTGEPLELAGAFVHDLPWIGKPTDPDDMEEARKVRHALAMAVDRELINETLQGGLGWPVYIEYVSARHPRWQKKWEEQVKYDPEGAKALLAQTAFPTYNAALYVGPELGGGVGPAGEMGDAIAGFWSEIGYNTEVLKYAYAIFRPTVVGRTNTTPWLTSCDEGKDSWPWDWPKGMVQTSLTRGGFACGFESPEIAQLFIKQSKVLDPAQRLSMTDQYVDYMHHWMLDFGVVVVPEVITYNPKSIAEWPYQPAGFTNLNNLDAVVPASR